MKNSFKKILLILALLSIFSFTGCTTYLETEVDGKTEVVKNEETGQRMTKNILCQPEDEDILKVYDEYNETAAEEDKVDYESLPKCSEIAENDDYEGLWTSLFVKSLAWLLIKLGEIFNSYGFAIIVATILIRLAIFPFSRNQIKQSQKMKEAQPEIERLEKKYSNKDDREAMAQKAQETMQIYKKYNIKPLSGCIIALIQVPLFFAFYESILRTPVIFEENFLGIFELGVSPYVAIFTNHQYYYIIFVIIIAAATYFSFKLNGMGNTTNPDQAKQMKMMSNFMVIFMTFTVFNISTGIAVYWTISNTFTIVQNLLVKRGNGNDKNNK